MRKYYFIKEDFKLLDLEDIGFKYKNNDSIVNVNNLTKEYYLDEISDMINIDSDPKILEMDTDKKTFDIYKCYTKEVADVIEIIKQPDFELNDNLKEIILKKYKEIMYNCFTKQVILYSQEMFDFYNEQVVEMRNALDSKNKTNVLTSILMLENNETIEMLLEIGNNIEVKRRVLKAHNR